ncbi:MAG: hypothetical protein OXC17_14320 [Aestuariivita sp.]|nr:hypothetical protein [Aestuariivita sp.]
MRLKVGKTAGLAELSIGAIRDLKLDVLESPLDATDSWPSVPCHAEIVGISSNLEKQSLVYELLSDRAISKYPANSETN